MTSRSVIIRRAVQQDLHAVQDLLGKGKVSAKGLEELIEHFLVAERKDQPGIIGTAGIEIHGKHGLLRSLVIDAASCDPSFSLHLLEFLISFARQQKVENLYLLTGRAAGLFHWYGFQTISWHEVPLQIRESSHLEQYRPREMAIMVLPLEDKVGSV